MAWWGLSGILLLGAAPRGELWPPPRAGLPKGQVLLVLSAPSPNPKMRTFKILQF